MNENGDRDTDFTLIDLDPSTGDWRVRLAYLMRKQNMESLL